MLINVMSSVLTNLRILKAQLLALRTLNIDATTTPAYTKFKMFVSLCRYVRAAHPPAPPGPPPRTAPVAARPVVREARPPVPMLALVSALRRISHRIHLAPRPPPSLPSPPLTLPPVTPPHSPLCAAGPRRRPPTLRPTWPSSRPTTLCRRCSRGRA